MSIPVLYPLNDIAFVLTVKTVNAAGALVPLEASVSPVAFLAISDSPTATAADPTLSMTPTYTGAGGKWLISFDAAVLTPALLASLFGSTTPYIIAQFTSAIRVAVECSYQASRPVAP